MRLKASTPDTVVLALLCVLVVAGVVFGGASGGASGGGPTAGAEAAARRVAPIARRVEAIRGLRFERLPRPLIVTPAQAAADQRTAFDKEVSPSERRVNEQLLVRLGLLKPGTDLRKVGADITSEQVAGYYDPERHRLAIVGGPEAASDVLSEITLAHELDHALDDQRLGIRVEGGLGADDASSAYSALVEGTATSVMDDYARRFIDPGRALGSALVAGSSTEGIPPYVLSSLLFSYLAGAKFVDRLRSVAHGWKLVNYAFRSRPPRSTEQVIHPEKYLVDEKPVRVVLHLNVPRGWRLLTKGTIGEFDTHEVLKLAVSDAVAGDAAAGWGGGTYELLGPDLARSALVVGWEWDTPLEAAQFLRAVRTYARQADGAAVVRARGLRTVLVIAGTATRARALAAAALRRR